MSNYEIIVRPTYKVFIRWSEEDKTHIATVPSLPGCMAHGDTLAEVWENAGIAIDNWIETAKSLGREIPPPEDKA